MRNLAILLVILPLACTKLPSNPPTQSDARAKLAAAADPTASHFRRLPTPSPWMLGCWSIAGELPRTKWYVKTFELSDEPAPYFTESLRLTPLSGVPGELRFVSWHPRREGGLDIEFSTGYDRTVLRLDGHARELRGTLHLWSDAGLWRETHQQIRLVRVECSPQK